MSTASHSGHSHSGHSHSGHSHSGHGMKTFAGLDAYAGFAATGLLSDAMLRSREATVGALSAAVPVLPGLPPHPRNPLYYRAWMQDEFPDLDQIAHMARWAPHIRQHILDFVFLSSIRFSTSKVVGAGGVLEHHAVLADAAGAPIVTLVRPPIRVFRGQVDHVMQHAILRQDRSAEILTQVVPPIAYFASVMGLSFERTRFTMELLEHAQRFAMLVLMRFKHALACPRPVEYSPLVQPMLDTPPFSALPAGHATESYMFAGVMRRLAKLAKTSETSKQLAALAERISTNRVVAGLHFPLDNVAGRMLGETLAEYFVHLCAEARPNPPNPPLGWVPRVFDGEALNGLEDFDPAVPMDGAGATGAFGRNVSLTSVFSAGALTPSPANWLWDQAVDEMSQLGLT